MDVRRQRPTAWLLVLATVWVATWCCCVPPARASVVRSCCVARGDRPACPPTDCPIDHVRQTSVTSAAPVLPDARPTLPAPAAVVPMRPAVPVASAAVPSEPAIDPPCPPPTLLALHTSLVC